MDRLRDLWIGAGGAADRCIGSARDSESPSRFLPSNVQMYSKPFVGWESNLDHASQLLFILVELKCFSIYLYSTKNPQVSLLKGDFLRGWFGPDDNRRITKQGEWHR